MRKNFLILFFILIISFSFFFFQKNKESNSQKFVFWSIQLKPIFEKQINQIISEFKQKHPEIEVVWVDIPIQEAQKRTLASILSSNPPDLVNLNPDFSILLAQKNSLEFFEKETLSQFDSSLLSKLTYEDKIYAIPFYATSPVVIYNKEIFNKFSNKNFPLTYEELHSLAKEFKRYSPKAFLAINLAENDTLAKILNKAGVGAIKTKNEKEITKKIYSMFDDMYKKKYIPEDSLVVNHREILEKYMANQALSLNAGSNFIKIIKENAPDIYKKSALSKQLTFENKGYDIGLMNLIIPKKSKNKELALEFALLLTNEKNQLELAKVTNVLPVNKFALENDYFKNCSSDLIESARCIGASQLKKLNNIEFSENNRKFIIENLNHTLEEILLNEKSNDKFIQQKIEELSKTIN